MPKFQVELGWKYTAYDFCTTEVEADNELDAEIAALEMVHNLDWNSGDIIDGEYYVTQCARI